MGGESPRKTNTHNARPLGTWARCLVIPKTSATEYIVQARIADAAKPVIATYTISAATSMALRTPRRRGVRASTAESSMVTMARCVPETAMRWASPVVWNACSSSESAYIVLLPSSTPARSPAASPPSAAMCSNDSSRNEVTSPRSPALHPSSSTFIARSVPAKPFWWFQRPLSSGLGTETLPVTAIRCPAKSPSLSLGQMTRTRIASGPSPICAFET